MPKLVDLVRNRTAAGVAGVLLVLVVVGALALGGGGDGPDAAMEPSTASSTTSTGPPGSTSSMPSTSATGPAGPSTTAPGGGSSTAPTPTSVVDDRPSPSWASATVPRAKAPPEWLEAWERAKNRATCGLLAPTEAFPRMGGAVAGFDELNGDEGWNVRLREGGGIVEILGLFPKSAQPSESRPAPLTRTWKDGSVARYGPDVPPGMQEGEIDPEATAHEARLTIPDQDCVYQIYDTLGQSHLEFVLGHLAFVEGTRSFGDAAPGSR